MLRQMVSLIPRSHQLLPDANEPGDRDTAPSVSDTVIPRIEMWFLWGLE